MAYFCNDVDLMAWEPGIFFETAFAHQTLMKDAPATVAGTTLTATAETLAAAGIAPGMVARLTGATNELTQLAEIVSIDGAGAITISALRGRSTEQPAPPLIQGSVTLAVVSFRPQIAAVGDGLLARVGVTCDRETDAATPAYGDLAGFGPACIWGTLAAIFRTLCDAKSATNITYSKKSFYDGLAQAAAETLSATIDRDGDGVAETRVLAASAMPERA